MTQIQHPANPGDGGLCDYHVHCAQIGRIVAAVAAATVGVPMHAEKIPDLIRTYTDLYRDLVGLPALPGGSNPASDPDNDDDAAQHHDPDPGQIADVLLAAIEYRVRGTTQPQYVIEITLNVMDNLHPRVWGPLRDRVVFSTVIAECFARKTAPLEDRATVRNALDAKIESSKTVAGL